MNDDGGTLAGGVDRKRKGLRAEAEGGRLRPAWRILLSSGAGMIWLASYPRSGNTWLRFLLSSYLLGRAPGSEEMEGRIPNLHRENIGQAWAHDPALAKTHLPWSESHPHAAETRGVIYLIRHPKDVLLSNLNYFKLYKEAVEDREFILDFIQSGGAWTLCGRWEEHAASWIENSSLPRLVLRYEAMKAKPHSALENALRFLGLEPDPDEVSRAVRDCELPRLRQLEIDERRAQRSALFSEEIEQLDPEVFFFHQGGVGESLADFGDDLDELFDRRFSHSLRLLDFAARL